MQLPILSIIVPAYNSERYIKECLDSALNQKTEYPYEIVISVDPSVDKTEQIVHSYAKGKGKGIIVPLFEKERLGQAKSRMHAISSSFGKFITFLDADDILMPNAVDLAVKTMIKENVDFVNFSFSIIKENKKITPYPFGTKRNRKENGANALSLFFDDVEMRGFLWTKVFKRELFFHPLLSFYDFQDMFEDVALSFSLISHATSSFLSKETYYCYRKGVDNSATSQKRTDRTLRHLAVFAAMKKYLEYLGDNRLLKIYNSKLWRAKFSLIFDASRDKKWGNSKAKSLLKTEFPSLKKETPLSLEGKPYKEIVERSLSSFKSRD